MHKDDHHHRIYNHLSSTQWHFGSQEQNCHHKMNLHSIFLREYGACSDSIYSIALNMLITCIPVMRHLQLLLSRSSTQSFLHPGMLTPRNPVASHWHWSLFSTYPLGHEGFPQIYKEIFQSNVYMCIHSWRDFLFTCKRITHTKSLGTSLA